MCGIAGIISAQAGRFSTADVEKMSACIAHRGPDGDAAWQNEDGTAILGHRRLAIIDLSAAAAQPMHYLQRYTIVHNGEIYNYRELRIELEKRGYRFSSASDTEVILAAYDYWQEACLQQFDGMFAFAIWDQREKELFAARDRFGEKPFYFAFENGGGTLWFASEIKSFFTQGFSRRERNENMLLQYVANGSSLTTDHTATFFKQVRKLPQRHYLRYRPFEAGASPELVPYYDLDKAVTSNLGIAQAANHFRDLFFDSVKLRLRSDVEVGTSLSGGLDSSSVVAAISAVRESGIAQQAFTASFPGFEKDETEFARLIADQFQLRHHLVSPGARDMADDLDRFFQQHDEPISSASVYAQYKVFQLAKQHGVKVLLDGQGADETLAGYPKYVQWFLQELYRSGSEIYREAAAAFDAPLTLKNKLASRFPHWAAVALEKKAAGKQMKHPGLNQDFVSAFYKRDEIYKPAVTTLNDILYHDVFGGNLESLLRNADRNAMAHGIEVRLPFLSHRLVEFVFAQPSAFKLHQGYSKYLLRSAMSDLLPQQVAWRKDKTGFEPPQQQWMQDNKIQEMIRSARQQLVNEKVLSPTVLNTPIAAKAAHEADNYDWRYLAAASLF